MTRPPRSARPRRGAGARTAEDAPAPAATAAEDPTAAEPAPPEDVDPDPDAPTPRFDEVGDDFFEELYLALNPDVAAALQLGLPSGEAHWRRHGAAEADERGGLRANLAYRAPARTMMPEHPVLAQVGFDPGSYLYLNPDVRRVTRGDPGAARDHWLNHGQYEGRIAPGVFSRPHRHVNLGRLEQRPLGINVLGPFGTASGLGTASRAMARAVKATGLPFELLPYDWSTGELRPAAMEARARPSFRINLLIANADQVRRVFAAYPEGFFDDAYNIGVWQWELASPRPDFFYECAGLDEVWTNSDFQQAALRALVPVPVAKVHIPVAAPGRPIVANRALFGIPPGPFVFLVTFDVGSTSARKNPFAAIEAFRQVQADHPGVHLVLKYHSGKFESAFTRTLLDSVVGVANVTVLSSEIGLPQLDQLRAVADCLISPHRSEGFGLNIAEFLSLGKPVIATGYSGNMDFFDETVGFPIGFAMTEIKDQAGPYMSGFTWAEPSVASIVEQMRTVLEQPDEVAKRGAAGVARIEALLSVDAVSASIGARLRTLEFDTRLPTYARAMANADQVAMRTVVSHAGADVTIGAAQGVTPLLSVVVPVYNVPARYLRACIDSVLAQTYVYWELCLCDDGSTAPDTVGLLNELRGSSPRIKVVRHARNQGIAAATNRAVDIATGSYVVLLDNDDLLLPTALEEVVRAVVERPEIDVLYSDEEKIGPDDELIEHFHKPDWSPEHLESVMYVLHMLVVRKTLLMEAGGLRAEYDGAQDYDLVLRLSRLTRNIHHIAKVVYRWRAIPGSAAAVIDAKPAGLQNGRRALAAHALEKYGPLAAVEPGLLTGTFRLRRPLPHKPDVTLLIITGNARMDLPERGEVSLVDNLVASIRKSTDYPNYKVEVIDNATLSKAQRARFAADGVLVRDHAPRSGPGRFNYAAKANFAMRGAGTDSIVLMNDDMEVIRPDWLTALVELSSDPQIGAVGARLLHLDGSIQHVGTVLGVNTGAAHAYHSYPREFVGYNGFTHIIRNYSAVTAACLATRRSVAAQVGWMDERLAIDFNDVDFCLRIIAAGYRIAYTPYAELYHYEGVSARRTVQDPAEVALFHERWGPYLENDPFYNPNLTRTALDFSRP